MRTLKKNQVKFGYALFDREEVVLDEYGNETGTQVIHKEPVYAYGNISSANGDASIVQFGTDVAYDKVIVVESTEIDENSILWVDTIDLSKPYDYVVKQVSKSLNSVSIAISKVKVS